MDVSELTKAIDTASSSTGTIRDVEKRQLLSACEKLRQALETPYETTLRLIFAAPQSVMLRLGIDMKLFDAAASISETSSNMTIDQLADQTGTERLFVRRLMRILAAMYIFNEVSQDTFSTTPLAAAFVTGSPFAAGVIHMTAQLEVLFKLPEYFEDKGYSCPKDSYDGSFQYARNTQLHSFEWIAEHPRLQEAFNVVITLPRQNRNQPWYEFFPVESKLQVNNASDDLLVDVGGGVGHILLAFKKAYPTIRGKLTLQDIPSVIDATKNIPDDLETMKHNFFDAQPIKGAKGYYLANVLHDWPDKQAHIIISNIKEAMNSDSMLLINENVLPETNVSLYSATVDWTMMEMHSALERTQEQFETLFKESGFKVVQVWEAPGPSSGSERLFEAVLA